MDQRIIDTANQSDSLLVHGAWWWGLGTRVHWNVPSFWLQILLKGGIMHMFKKLVTHARSGPNSAILKSKMAAIQKLLFAKNY